MPGRRPKPTAANQPRTSTPRHKLPVVAAVGIPTDGLDAFPVLLKALPAETGMALALVQHLNLGANAPAKAISLFHFGLRADGVLLLGKAETAGYAKGQFNERLYRQVGVARPGDLGVMSRALTGPS